VDPSAGIDVELIKRSPTLRTNKKEETTTHTYMYVEAERRFRMEKVKRER